MKKYGTSIDSVKAMDAAMAAPKTPGALGASKIPETLATKETISETTEESPLTKLRKSEIAESNIQKMDNYREKATAAIEDMTEKEEEKKKSSIVNNSPTVVNAPNNISNTTQNIVRPQIRNPEPTYIRLENKRFAF